MFALSTATDARATIDEHGVTLEAEARWRALVTDMLRHAPAGDAVDEPLLRIARGGGDSLIFLSQGVVQPFGTGRIWRVTVSSSEAGVRMDAEAIGRGDPMPPVHATLPHLTMRDVMVLEGDAATSQWRSDWPVERTRPALVRLQFATRSADGAPGVRRVNSRGRPRARRADVYAVPPLLVGLAPLDAATAASRP